MHYFVTGAVGSIGRYLTSLLLAEGHAVTTLVRSRQQAQAMADYGIRPHLGDVRDKESMRRGMRGADGVFHTATWARVGSRDRKTAQAVNVQGTRNVLELIGEMHIPKAVYTSSVHVFSDTRRRRPDETYRFEGKHLSIADRTQWEAHYEVALPMMRGGLPVVIVQPGVVYGPGDDSNTARLLRRYLLGKVPVAPTRTAASWVHVEDVAAGHLLAMEAGTPGRSYLLCGEDATLLEVMRMAGRLVGKRRGPLPIPGLALRPLAGALRVAGHVIPPLAVTAERMRRMAGATFLGDDIRARRELGYAPRSLGEGMPDTVRSVLQDLFESH
ncbi:MAG: NAD-dependent epimerase/dehydratase family protein [Actinobacteria bacterium]|nr:NAD-dependent epimerase/dehydratase family protein [Actinomycetota bacterium]